LQDLQRRLLLTPSDAEFFASGRRPEDGADLLTIRMEKLIEMGLYDDAAELYRRMVDEPYHVNLARHGIHALMLSGRGALACMEVNTGWERFREVPEWQVFRGICSLSTRDAGAQLPGGADLADSKSDLLRDL